MRTRTLICLAAAAFSLGLVQGCRTQAPVWPESGKKRVLASFAPLYCFAKNVAGEDADVRCLLTSTGPHHFELSHHDYLLINEADLVLLNGLDLDEFVVKQVKKKDRVFRVGDTLPHEYLLHPEHGEDHADHGHKHGEHDPHVWLAPDKAKQMVEQIAAKLAAIDPTHKKGYEERAQTYIKELQKLHEHGVAALGKKNCRLVTTHDALAYFAEAFKLEIVGSIHPKAGVEGDARKLAELVKLCKEKRVGVIAVEPQYSQGPAKALQRQLQNLGVSVQLVEVDPMETAPPGKDGADPDPGFYVKRMQQNIDLLAKALP